MLTYPQIDPIALSLGPLKVHWYGITYLIAFSIAFLIGRSRAKRPTSLLKPEHIEDLVFYVALGIVLGGRFGYVFFYNFGKFLDDPLWLFAVWEGGMSFHGGLIGGFIALMLYGRKLGVPTTQMADFVTPMVPLGIGCGRIGNFIGQELWGRETNVPWGMIFPADSHHLVRHPSQLYEFFLEGIVLFCIVYFYSNKPRPAPSVMGVGIFFYGIFRFSVEFFREPDAHIGIDAFGWMTRGQILSAPMIIIGLALIIWAYKKTDQTALAEAESKKLAGSKK